MIESPAIRAVLKELAGWIAGGAVIVAGALPVSAGTWTVSNLNDSGAGSLRQAILDATATPESDVIWFIAGLAGTITLGEPLSPGGTMTINGPGANRVAISGNDASRVFTLGAGANLTVNDLTIRNGRSPAGTGSQGGGIYASAATLQLNRCIVRNNVASAVTASYGGGIFGVDGSSVTLNDCTLHSNTASANTFSAGGGLSITGGSLTMNRCTLSGNHCQAGTVVSGGAAYISGAAVTLDHCTIAGNLLSAVFPEAGGLYIAQTNSVALARTLLSGNTAGNCYRTSATLTSLGFNLDSDGTSGLANGVNGDIVGGGGGVIDARLASLADNGGPTPTMALLPDSPAIDAAIATASPRDQRGYPRVAEGNCAEPASADIGAYEYNAGRGLNFDAVDDHVDLSNGPELNLTNNFTLEAWVRPDTLDNLTGATRILSKRSNSNTGYGFGQTQGGKLLLTTFGIRDYVTSGTYLTPGQWTHVAVKLFGSADAVFYVNGQEVEAVLGAAPATISNAPVHIGRNPHPDAQMWDGAIADVRIWNVSRSAAEIAANYNRVLEGTEPGLVAYYKLDEGESTTVINSVTGGVANLSGAPAWLVGVPCPCLKGDANCDGEINFFDIDPFIMALFDRTAYATLFCGADECTIDMDCSGEVNFFDIDPFVGSLFGETSACP